MKAVKQGDTVTFVIPHGRHKGKAIECTVVAVGNDGTVNLAPLEQLIPRPNPDWFKRVRLQAA